MTIIEYFESNGFTSIKQTGRKWADIGAEFELSEDAARKRMARHWGINIEAIEEEKKFEPRILVFDLETAPLSAYVWRLWKQNVNPLNGQLQSEWFLLTYAAKWLFDETMISGKLTKEEALAEDDTRLVQELWNLLNEADIVIAHNGAQFDVPILNGRFLKKGLPPPMPYKVIDTLKTAKKQFNLPSLKLDYIGQYLGLGNKIKTEFELWVNCLKGDDQALLDMEVYNVQDVKLLESVYLTMRPYIQPHPNLGLLITEDIQCCPSCTSTDLKWGGMYTTYTNSYKAFRCNHCGSIGRDRIPQKKHLNLAKPIPV